MVVFPTLLLVFQGGFISSSPRFSNDGEKRVYKRSSSLQLIGGWTPVGRKDPCCLNGFSRFSSSKRKASEKLGSVRRRSSILLVPSG